MPVPIKLQPGALGPGHGLWYNARLDRWSAICTVRKSANISLRTCHFGVLAAVFVVLSLCVTPFTANATEPAVSLEALTKQRQALAEELLHYEKTVALLHPDVSPAQDSENPAVRTLATEMAKIRQRLINITEREVTLLQEQIFAARAASAEALASEQVAAQASTETKPTPPLGRDYSLEQEARDVVRLRGLLSDFYIDQQESLKVMPSADELARRRAADDDARKMATIPFNADKVRLNGSEGSTALNQITRRLSDPKIAESRRDIAPICSIKTRLYGSLIGSETRSMRPVGKHHYVARIRMHPGDTTLRVLGQRWEVSLPKDGSSAEYLFTLYAPPAATPELHVFAVDDLLAADSPHIPAWLPDELGLKPRV
jgi:hypothetical protein